MLRPSLLVCLLAFSLKCHGSAVRHFRGIEPLSMWMNNVSCKDAFLSCSKIVLLVYMCMSITESLRWAYLYISVCVALSHGGPWLLKVKFEVFVRTSFIDLVSSEPLLTEECSCLARLLHSRVLSAAVGSQPATWLLHDEIEAWTWWDRGKIFRRAFIPVLWRRGKKIQIPSLDRETSFSKCIATWCFSFFWAWICTWGSNGFQSHYWR